MRDWRFAFRRASFRGAPFWVEQDGPEVGRRVAVHEISGGEIPVTEDMGRRALETRVRAYLASDYADAEGLTLEAACSTPGPSLLVLPMDPPRMMHCVACRRSRERDRGGFIAYDLFFVEAGAGALAVATGLPALRLSFSAGLGGVAAGISIGF